MTDITSAPGALDRVLAEQAHQYAAMLVANHSLGRYDNLDALTRGLTGRPDLVPGVVHRLLEKIGGGPDDED